jgi:hypothetical protein
MIASRVPAACARGAAARGVLLVVSVVGGFLGGFLGGFVPAARAEGAGPNETPDAGGAFTDRREIIVPVPAGSVEVLRIDNPMGRVEIRGGPR